MSTKLLIEFTNEEIEHLYDYINDKNKEERNKKNYIIIHGPKHCVNKDKSKNICTYFDRVRFENMELNKYKMIYNMIHYEKYGYEKSPELEYIVDTRKLFNFPNLIDLNYIVNMIIFMIYFVYVFIRG